MTMISEELLPCPFCGAVPKWEENDAVDARSWGPEYRIACRNAACFGPVTSNYGNRPDAIAAWNRRAPPSGEAGEVTDEMVERAMKEFALIAHKTTPERYDEDKAASQTYPIGRERLELSRKAIRAALTAALPTIKEPTDGK